MITLLQIKWKIYKDKILLTLKGYDLGWFLLDLVGHLLPEVQEPRVHKNQGKTSIKYPDGMSQSTKYTL